MSSSQRSSTPMKQTQKPSPQISTPQTESLLSSETPDKPVPKPRSRRSVAMSISEVRRSARNIRASSSKPDQLRAGNERIKSAKKQILLPESPVKKLKNADDVADKLPEKYKMLADFFDALDSSIRFLRLRRYKPSFSNICSQVESMTDRKFSYAHLAQMKFILPKVIEFQKILAFDEQTCSMQPELHVLLNMESLEEDENFKGDGRYLQLRKLFRMRLMDFIQCHPEGDEVPEEALPGPFNRSKQKQQSDIRPPVRRDMHFDAVTNEQLVVASHLPRTFRRFFSQKHSGKEMMKTLQNESSVEQSVPLLALCNKVSSFEETISAVASPAKAALEKEKDEDYSAASTSSSLQSLDYPITPGKEMDCMKSADQSTPAKLVLTPARLMSMTSSVNSPKRSDISPDDDSKCSMRKLARRPPRNRSLKFDDDLDDLLPADLLQSIRDKEKKAKEQQDPAISQAKRRKQMIASLPKLLNMIRYLFQSLARAVITKSELMQKLLASHHDVAERNEVEEQLDLLLELIPDWISEKLSSTGDLLISISKSSNLESVRMRLEQAK